MNNRPVASLSPTLLARKGAARPAMRPQLPPLRAFQDSTARQLDDLGWNDMGHEADGPVEMPEMAEQPTPIVQIAEVEAPQGAEILSLKPGSEPALVSIPEVVHQQEQIAERLARPRRSALSDGRRAAFTLRLDGERHLKLRLACVTRSCSAQQLLVEALDALLADLPEVADMAAKVRKRR